MRQRIEEYLVNDRDIDEESASSRLLIARGCCAAFLCRRDAFDLRPLEKPTGLLARVGISGWLWGWLVCTPDDFPIGDMPIFHVHEISKYCNGNSSERFRFFFFAHLLDNYVHSFSWQSSKRETVKNLRKKNYERFVLLS